MKSSMEYLLRSILGSIDKKKVDAIVTEFSQRLASEISRTIIIYVENFLESKIRCIIRDEIRKMKEGENQNGV